MYKRWELPTLFLRRINSAHESDPEHFQVQVSEKLHLGREIKDSASHEKSQLYEMLIVKLTFM